MKKLFQTLALLAAFILLIILPQVAADGVRSALDVVQGIAAAEDN